MDTNLVERSYLITCKTFNKTEIFSQTSLWLNLAYSFENDGLAVKIKYLCYLEAEILTKTFFTAAIL